MKLPGLAAAVVAALKGNVGHGRTSVDLSRDDLAIWIETRIGLKNVDHKPERASPVSRERAAAALAADCGLSEEDCAAALRNALIGFSTPENLRGVPDRNDEPLFAFKLHQFIAGAGAPVCDPSSRRPARRDGFGSDIQPEQRGRETVPSPFLPELRPGISPGHVADRPGPRVFREAGNRRHSRRGG